MNGPSPMWYAARGLGMALLLVVTANVVLGVVTSSRWRSQDWPRFLTAELHRNLSLLALTLLPLHGLAVIIDPYARLGLRDVLVPFASSYRPLWLGLGVLAGELLVAIVAVSLLRRLIGYRLWRLTHWASYAIWPLALLHGLGTGSDVRFSWSLLITAGSVVAVLLAVLVRLSLHRPEVGGGRLAAGVLVTAGVLVVAVWTTLGPLQPGWAAASGTPPDLLGSRQGQTPSPAPTAAPPAAAPAAAPSSTPVPAPAGLAAGLDDQLDVRVARVGQGQLVTMTDTRDRSLQLTVIVSGATATSGPFEARVGGRLVCQAQATFAQDITAVCGGTRVTIGLFRQDQGLAGEMTTEAAG